MLNDNEGSPEHGLLDEDLCPLPASLTLCLGPACPWPRAVRIFDPEALNRQIAEMDPSHGSVFLGPSEELDPGSLTTEEQARLHALKRLARDPRGSRRRLLVGTPPMLERVTNLHQHSPQFRPAIDLVARAVQFSMLTGSGLRVPPLLLLGPPGIGKIYFTKHLAAALATRAEAIAMNAISDAALLLGHPTSWRGAKQGQVTRALIECPTASPVFLLDEVDKMTTHRDEDPYAILLTLLERENAARAMDEYLLVPFDLSRAVFILTANGTETIPPPVLDRLLVIDVPAPTGAQLQAVVRSLYRVVAAELGLDLPEPNEELLELLAPHNPRRIGHLLELAFGYAAAQGRTVLTATDIAAADALTEQVTTARTIGFTLTAQGKRTDNPGQTDKRKERD